MEQFDVIKAEFRPKRVDDLVKGADEWIGVACDWLAAWQIEEGEYKGDWAMTPCLFDPILVPIGWAPLSDLKVVSDQINDEETAWEQ